MRMKVVEVFFHMVLLLFQIHRFWEILQVMMAEVYGSMMPVGFRR